MEFLKRDNKFMRAIDRIGFALLAFILWGLSDGVSPEDILTRVFIQVMTVILTLALVLLVSMDLFEFMENNFKPKSARIRLNSGDYFGDAYDYDEDYMDEYDNIA